MFITDLDEMINTNTIFLPKLIMYCHYRVKYENLKTKMKIHFFASFSIETTNKIQNKIIL